MCYNVFASMLFYDLIGYAAGFCTTVAYLPQAFKVYRTKQTKDISIGMFLIMVAGVLFWLYYGFLVDSTPIILANVITIFLTGYILVMKIKLDLLKSYFGEEQTE